MTNQIHIIMNYFVAFLTGAYMHTCTVTMKTFGLLPDEGWIWLDFADFKHDYIKEIYQSGMRFVSHGLRTGKF